MKVNRGTHAGRMEECEEKRRGKLRRESLHVLIDMCNFAQILPCPASLCILSAATGQI